MLENITFKMNLVSRLTAAVCASGKYMNFDIAKHPGTVTSHDKYKVWL